MNPGEFYDDAQVLAEIAARGLTFTRPPYTPPTVWDAAACDAHQSGAALEAAGA